MARGELADLPLGPLELADLAERDRAPGTGKAEEDLERARLEIDLLAVPGDRRAHDLAGEETVEVAPGGGQAQIVPDQLRPAVDQIGAGRPERGAGALGRQDLLGVGLRHEMLCREADPAEAPGADPGGPVDLRHLLARARRGLAGEGQRRAVVADVEIAAGQRPAGEVDLDLIEQRGDLPAAQQGLGIGQPASPREVREVLLPVTDSGILRR